MRVRFPLLLILVSCFLSGIPSFSQTPGNLGDTLRIVRIDTDNFPTVRIHIRVFCGGIQDRNVNTVTTTVADGTIFKQFTLRCPNETLPISVALALDKSGSVAGTSMYRIQQGAWQFVELFQQHATGSDEAAIVSFADKVTLEQTMTSDKNDLFSVIQQLYAMGATSLWDAVLLALYQVYTYGRNPIKAVVVLSDGDDNASMNSLGDVIRYAQFYGIPVYTIGIAYHSKPEDIQRMRMLADSTGGQYIQVDHPDDIVAAYNTIASLITGGANDCIIEYKTECPDGSLREVTVTTQACGKTLTQKAKYRVPLDPTLPTVSVRFDSSYAYANGDLYIPVLISAIGSQANITNLAFKILKQDLAEYVGLITDRYFAKNFTVTSRMTVDTLTVQLSGNATLTGTDTLLVIRFKGGNVPKDSTLPLLLFYFDKNTQQCMQLKVQSSKFTLLVRPSLQSACNDSLHVKWDQSQGMYSPNIITLTANITNNGKGVARNTRAWITLPPGVKLASGPDTVFLSASEIPVGKTEQVSFPVQIVPIDSARQFLICISVLPDSGTITTCCAKLTVERGKPALRAWCFMPKEIRWDDSTQTYKPDQFPITIYVTNISPVLARSVEAWIHVPQGFKVSDATPINTFVTPSLLRQSDTGKVIWMVSPLDRETSDTLSFCIKAAAGLDTVVCCQNVYVTKAPVRASLSCVNPRVIRYDEEKGEYDPPQFLASTMVRNTSGIPMTFARGRITFPSFISLGPGETALKNLPGGAVIQPGDSALVVWTLVATKPPTGDSVICIEILASNFPGALCCIDLRVQTNLAIPTLACSLSGPDTIRFLETEYEPNPFTLQLKVDNIGNAPAKGVYAALLQGADLSIDSSDMALKLIADSLAVAQSVNSSFKIRVLNRNKDRYDTIRVSVYATNGGAVVCEKIIYIEAVRGPALELKCSGPDSLVFSDSLNSYLPSPFLIQMVATNTGTATADSVVAEFLPPPNVELLAGEQARKLLQPSTLAVSQSGVASWQVNALPRSTGRIDTIRVQANAKGKPVGSAVPCIIPVYIPPARKAQLELLCEPTAEIVVIGEKYSPDPLTVRLLVKNTGDARAFDISATVLGHTRLPLASGENSTKYAPFINAVNGQYEFSWNFNAIPSTVGDTAELCFRVSARFQNDIYCCAKIYLPPIPTAGIATSCSSVDTVRFDQSAGGYPNPVLVKTTITNPTQITVDSVRALILLPAGVQLSLGEIADRLAQNLAPQQSKSFEWRVDIIRDTSTVIKKRQIRIQYFSGGIMYYCDLSIVVLPAPPDTTSLSLSMSCSAPDSIRYINAQIGLQPSPFTVSVEVLNTGSAILSNIKATLVLPSEVNFSTGENSTKQLGVDLHPGQRGTISWSCVPTSSDVTRTANLKILVDALNVPEHDCRLAIIIERVERAVILAATKGNVVQVGGSVLVPVFFTNQTMASVNGFRFDVASDHETVKINQVIQDNSLTKDWQKIQVTEKSTGVITLEGASNVPIIESGILLHLLVRGISGDGTANQFGWKRSELILDNPVFPPGIRVELRNGDIVTAGDCLFPLDAKEKFSLQQNTPNPFNPLTTIGYNLPANEGEQNIILDVYDSFGRFVKRIDEGWKLPGKYSAVFDATGLPSGLYHYRLVAGGRIENRIMIFTK